MALSPEHIKRAWVDFKVHKDPEARVDLINHYSYLVKITAGRLVTSLPGGLDREDLIDDPRFAKKVDRLTRSPLPLCSTPSGRRCRGPRVSATGTSRGINGTPAMPRRDTDLLRRILYLAT